MIYLKQSTAVDVMLGPFVDDTDGKTTEEALTLSQADLQLSKNGGAAAQKNDATAGTHRYGGNYMIDLNTTDTNTLGHMRLMCKESGALPVIADFMVVTANWFDTMCSTDQLDVNVTNVSGTAQTANDNGADINAILIDVTGLNGDVMRGTDGANTTVPDAAGIAATPAEVATALTNIGLDHLVFVAVAGADIADDSIIAQLASKSGTADWDSFDNTTDALEAISDKVVAAAPQDHIAESSNDTTGTIDSGTYADTATVNTTYWQISPVTPAVGGFGLNVDLVFSVGTGLDRVPAFVHITGYFEAIPVRPVNVWAYNYILADWDEISNSATNMQHATSNQNYQYNININHINTSTGAMRIRFTAESITISDDLYIDHVSVGSVAAEAAGLTADAIQMAVWSRIDSGHDEDTLGYNLSKFFLAKSNPVAVTSASQFTIADGVTNNDAYNGMFIMLEDKTDEHYEVRRIVDWIGATREVFVDRAFSFTPVAEDDAYLMSAGYADVNVTHVNATAQTANDNGADINAILVDTADMQPRVAAIEIDTGTTLDGKIDTIDGIVDAILVDVTGLNGDVMRGTDNAATETKQDIIDTNVDSILTLVTALQDLSAAEVNAEVVDVMKVDTVTEMAQGAPPASPTLEEILNYVYRKLRNKEETTASETATYDNAGTTKLFKSTLTDDATTFTKNEAGTGA